MEKVDIFSSDLPGNVYHKALKKSKRFQSVNNIPVEDEELEIEQEKPFGTSNIIRKIDYSNMDNGNNGACGGTRKFDGSCKGIGNITFKQESKEDLRYFIESL